MAGRQRRRARADWADVLRRYHRGDETLATLVRALRHADLTHVARDALAAALALGSALERLARARRSGKRTPD